MALGLLRLGGEDNLSFMPLDTPGSLLLPDDTSKNHSVSSDGVVTSRQDPSSSTAVSSSTTTTYPTFLEVATKTGTDKVRGTNSMAACRTNKAHCRRPEARNEQCRVVGHFYNDLYQRWLEPWQDQTVQFLEIGFFQGKGFAAYQQFLPHADHHSLEVACLPHGDRKDGKWPWDNSAKKSPQYQQLIETEKLHCADASQFQALERVYHKMRQPTSPTGPPPPPLQVVVEDASHLSMHMAISVLYWFPRLAPGGLLFVEDLESMESAHDFRHLFLPQLVSDLHYCGLPAPTVEKHQVDYCFPTLTPLIKSISCQLHICVLERNDQPSIEYDKEHTMPPADLFRGNLCWQSSVTNPFKKH